MRDKYKPRQAVESQERVKWTTKEDEFIIKAQQRFATIYNKWVKIAELLEGRSNIDVCNRWSGSLWNYERTHPHLQGHATVLVKHFVSEDHDGMNLSGLYRMHTYDRDGAAIYTCQLDNQEHLTYIRRHANRWWIQHHASAQYSSPIDNKNPTLPPKDTWERRQVSAGPELELFY